MISVLRSLTKFDYCRQLKPADLQLLEHVKLNYGSMSANALMKHTYLNYPFYAIRSTVAGSILSEEELVKVNDAKPTQTETVLFTIGYEEISLEEYLVRLLKNDIV